ACMSIIVFATGLRGFLRSRPERRDRSETPASRKEPICPLGFGGRDLMAPRRQGPGFRTPGPPPPPPPPGQPRAPPAAARRDGRASRAPCRPGRGPRLHHFCTSEKAP